MAGRNSKRVFVVKEIKRQSLHLIIGLVTTLLIYFGFIPYYVPAIIVLVGIGLAVWHEKKGLPYLGFFLREFDRDDFIPGYGAISLMAGIFLAFALFNKDFAFIAASSLAIVDSFAAAFGIFLSEPKKKSYWASILGGLVNVAFLTSFFTYIPGTYAVLGSAVGAATELFHKKRFLIDDNIAIPLAVGIVLVLVKLIFTGQ